MQTSNINNFDIVSDRPETDFYKELRAESVPCIHRLLIEYISNNDNDTKLYATTFYSKFKTWCQNTNRTVSYTDTRFGRELKQYQGISKKRTKRGYQYTLNFDTIQTQLIEQQYVTQDECLIDSSSDSECE